MEKCKKDHEAIKSACEKTVKKNHSWCLREAHKTTTGCTKDFDTDMEQAKKIKWTNPDTDAVMKQAALDKGKECAKANQHKRR